MGVSGMNRNAGMLLAIVLSLQVRAAGDPAAVAAWEKSGRAETLEWFKRHWFGVRPAERLADQEIGEDYVACHGGQIRINIYVKLPEGASAENPVPAFIFGDHYNPKTSRTKTDTMPGIPTNAIVSRGYAYIRFNFNDVTPNTNQGCHDPSSANMKLGGMGNPDSWGTISAWAWGFSRVMDWVETRPELDAKRIAVIGHSRGGKTALWAGCTDQRIALTISNCSGTGGARYLHMPLKGMETLDWMKDHATRHWFCPSWIPTYRNRETEIEHDADEMIMLIAPRRVYVASGSEDSWAGPAGEFESAKRASALWEAYGHKGLSLDTFPVPGTVDHSGRVGYHLRPGAHAIRPWDWDRYMDFMDKHLPGPKKAPPKAMEPAAPESQRVQSEAILAWINALEAFFDGGEQGSVHGFSILRHGKVIAEGSWKPFDTLHETHMLYSLSKSFASTAIGLLVDDGKLDLDERITDLFPEYVPAEPSENLKAMRVRDLLSMNVGTSHADPHKKDPGGDWVKMFVTNVIDGKPGQAFRYDSSATHVLVAIAEKRSGRTFLDFIGERLFDRIGIGKNAWTTYSPTGIACGGWGLNLTTRDLARFGQLYLQRGVWNGERVLSREWVELATARHTWNGGIVGTRPDDDWAQGYGFQFWRCVPEGVYRADGAYGQYTIVLPDQDMVVSMHAGVKSMGKILKLTWEHLLPGVRNVPLPVNTVGEEALQKRLGGLAIAPVKGSVAEGAYFGRELALKENNRGIRSIRLDREGEGWKCTLVTRAGENAFPVGCGVWAKGTIRIDTEKYEKPGGLIGVQPTVASGGVDADGVFRMKVFLTGTTAYLSFEISEKQILGRLFAIDGCRFEGKTE